MEMSLLRTVNAGLNTLTSKQLLHAQKRHRLMSRHPIEADS
jgi:hypothetical protein